MLTSIPVTGNLVPFTHYLLINWNGTLLLVASGSGDPCPGLTWQVKSDEEDDAEGAPEGEPHLVWAVRWQDNATDVSATAS